jgi:hypothetical protein
MFKTCTTLKKAGNKMTESLSKKKDMRMYRRKVHFVDPPTTLAQLQSRVARWHIFKPKSQIWVNFGGSCNGRCWFILWAFGLFNGNLVYLMDIRHFLGSLAYFSPFWYAVRRKIWQPCSSLLPFHTNTQRTWTHKRKKKAAIDFSLAGMR